MPRTAVQAKALDEMGCRPNLVISLEVPGTFFCKKKFDTKRCHISVIARNSLFYFLFSI